VRRVQHLRSARNVLSARADDADRADDDDAVTPATEAVAELTRAISSAEAAVAPDAHALVDEWPATVEAYSGDTHPSGAALTRTTLSGNKVPRVALPRYHDHGDLLRFLRAENLPGRFPFTAGVFPFKREGEDPARMFAGEGDAFR